MDPPGDLRDDLTSYRVLQSQQVPMNLTPINSPSIVENSKNDFQIVAPPGTDIWRKPPSTDVSNAPCYVAYLPASNFRRVRVTVTADWTRQYDQGGLVLFLPSWPSFSLWVKAGIEFVDGEPHVSVVAARDAADWSLLPALVGKKTITLELEREEVNEEAGTGSSLWVYLIQDEKKMPIREVTWVFKDKVDLAGMISVGIYAARPTKVGEGDNEALKVQFNDMLLGY